jgi:hypothetical protein
MCVKGVDVPVSKAFCVAHDQLSRPGARCVQVTVHSKCAQDANTQLVMSAFSIRRWARATAEMRTLAYLIRLLADASGIRRAFGRIVQSSVQARVK